MLDHLITVLVSSSPCRRHPATDMIEETIESIRYHLPKSRIIVMLDGVRPEQDKLRDAYFRYITTLAEKTLFGFHNVALFPFWEHRHQAAMTRQTLEVVDTPLVLFVEHDTPLVARPVHWDMLGSMVMGGATNHVRLHYNESIHPDHQHMMCGKLDDHLIKTVQWHNRPYLTKKDWFAYQLRRHFSPDARCFIEDRIYSPVSSAAWEDYRLTIYDPEGTAQNMKRSRDLDGRGGEPKFDNDQVW